MLCSNGVPTNLHQLLQYLDAAIAAAFAPTKSISLTTVKTVLTGTDRTVASADRA
jgi:hypothetical protein